MPSLPPQGQTEQEALVMPRLSGCAPVITQDERNPIETSLLKGLNLGRKAQALERLPLPQFEGSEVTCFKVKDAVWRGENKTSLWYM